MSTDDSTGRHKAIVWIAVAVFAGACLAVGFTASFAAKTVEWIPVSAATVAGTFWIGQLTSVASRTECTEATNSVARYVFSLANSLTLVRSGLYSVVAGFAVVTPSPEVVWVPALCYGSGVVLDSLDGTVARTVGRETPLGERFDLTADTAGLVAAPLVAVLWGLLPWWYLTVSAARYVFIGVIRWRRYRGYRVFETPEGPASKYIAGGQMLFVTMALVPVVPASLTQSLAPIVITPTILVFGRDILAVSGRYPPNRRSSYQ